MKKGVIQPVKYRPVGGITTDIDPLGVQGGNYIGKAFNIHHLTRSGNTTESVEITKGNYLGYTLPIVDARNKTFRVYIDVTANLAYTFQFDYYDGNGTIITNGTPVTLSTPNNLIVSFGEVAGRILLDMGGANINNGGGITRVDTSATTCYFDFAITTIAGWDYSITEQILLSGLPVDLPTFIIVQEAIDQSMTGQLKTIGKYDLLGDLFVWSTNQEELPKEIAVTNAILGSGVLIQLTVSDTTGITTGSLVNVKSVGGVPNASGNWIVTVLNGTVLELQGSIFAGAYTSGGVLTMNPKSLGEIGVALRDDNTETWTYITLLRSNEFDFRVIRQPKTYCERNDRLASLYWTDNYNVVRVLYYSGAYMTNGALNYIDSLNQYDYGTIAEETTLLRGNGFFNLAFDSQSQAGGSLDAGDYRYVVRLLTENLTPTLWTDVSNPINVCRADIYNVSTFLPQVGGNNPFAVTGKINNLLVSGIEPNLYKYIELGAIYYAGGTVVGTIVRRDVLTQESTQIIQHRGDETDTQTLDLAEISAISADILTALNIDSVDSRLVLSNTTSSAAVDFSEITNKWTHTLSVTDGSFGRPSVTAVRIPNPTGNYRSGEYMTPDNVNGKVGYMFNEIYRFGAKFKLKSGFITDTFWIDDVRFDTLATNLIANPTDDRRIVNNITTYDLTDITGAIALTPYIEFDNIDSEALVDGIRFKDLVEEIIFMRVDMTDDMIEVRGSGVFVLGVDMAIAFQTGAPYTNNINVGLNGGNAGTLYLDFPFVSGEWFYDQSAQVAPNNVTYNFTAYTFNGAPSFVITPRYNRKRRWASFYCPDYEYSNLDFNFLSSDTIINFGCPQLFTLGGNSSLRNGIASGGAAEFYSSLREFTGYTGVGAYEAPTVPNGANGVVISDAVVIPQDGTATVNGVSYLKGLSWTAGIGVGVAIAGIQAYPTSPVVATNQDLTANATGFTDYGLVMGQYYRFKGSVKFGAIATSKYIPVGKVEKITTSSVGVLSVAEIFGGDVFTQKSYYKHLSSTGFTDISGGGYTLTGFGQGFGFYSQNRVNTQMRNTATTTDSFQYNQYRYPAISPTDWLEPADAAVGERIINYNAGYTIKNSVTADPGFDINLVRDTHQPARIWWSDVKPENSVVDNYAIILPLNFRDEDLSYGSIENHYNIGGNLQVWQQRAFIQEYFNSSGILVTSAEEAVLGNAGVMTRKGSVLSTYGTKHGFSVIKGKTAAGKDCTYWINTESGKVMRHEDSDGTVCLSDVHQMRSFFNNNLRFADLYNTPAHGEGIHGVWDVQNSEAIWTVRAHKSGIEEWLPSTYIYGNIYDFDNTGTFGVLPQGSLIQHGGFMYGMTLDGGANVAGVLFKFNPVTFVSTVLYDFGIASGYYPYGTPTFATNNRIYGLTTSGGTNSLGTLFEYNPGTSTLAVLHNFAIGTGGTPFGDLVEGVAGIFYGMTSAGGSNSAGVLFRHNANTATYTVLRNFSVTTDGEFPHGSLLKDGGDLYGMCQFGGTNLFGTIFKWNIAGGTFTKLHDFAIADGGAPAGNLYKAANGKMYGVTKMGGTHSGGVLFEFNPTTNAYVVKYNFGEITGGLNESGINPVGSVTEYNGFLYGTCSAGGVNSVGTIWEWDLTNELFVPIHQAVAGVGVDSGSDFTGSLLAYNGLLYGMAQHGNVGGASSTGVIFTEDVTHHIYNTDDVVSFGTSVFEETPDFYVSLIDGNNNQDPPTSPLAWRMISRDDTTYYNEFTISFNEKVNKFTTFYSYKPKIYLQRGKYFLSPRPVDNEGRTYEHLHTLSDYATWYFQSGATPDEQSVDGEISGMIINADPDASKHFMALEMNTQVVPERVEFTTKLFQSYLDSSDFTARNAVWVAPIKNDSTVTSNNPTGVNNLDTSHIFGNYLSTKLVFKKKVFQKMFSVVVKCLFGNRDYRT